MDIIKTYEKPSLTKGSVSTYCLVDGLVVCASLIAYFFIMRSFGLHRILALRAFNILFLMAGILTALSHFSHKKASGKLEYFNGISIGAQVTLWAVIPFAAFVFVYLNFDPGFMSYLQETVSLGRYMWPAGAAIAISIEGLSSGFLLTFVAMPYFKRQ